VLYAPFYKLFLANHRTPSPRPFHSFAFNREGTFEAAHREVQALLKSIHKEHAAFMNNGPRGHGNMG